MVKLETKLDHAFTGNKTVNSKDIFSTGQGETRQKWPYHFSTCELLTWQDYKASGPYILIKKMYLTEYKCQRI